MKTIKMVEEFHKVFDHPIADKPTIIPFERIAFRENFLREELNELIEAWGEGDIVGIADAIGDIQYVLDGLTLECGLQDKMPTIIEEIHRSNMSKICKTMDEAIDLISELEKQAGIWKEINKFYFKKVGENYIVYRQDGKAMKSKNYSKPNLSKILSNDSK